MHAQHQAALYDEKEAAATRTAMPRNGITGALQTYRNEHLFNLSPVQVIQKLYDVAIQACKKQQYDVAQRALTELIMALNFQHQELALNLFQLYDYSKRCIRSGQVHEAVAVLEELRAVWTEAFHL